MKKIFLTISLLALTAGSVFADNVSVEADGTITQMEGTTLSFDAGNAFTLTPFSTNPKKRYAKWYGENSIAVKRSECKVYSGYMDGDFSLGLVQFKVDKNGLIHIPAKDAVLIITDRTELKYSEDDKPSTSWMGISDPYTDSQVLSSARSNALKYCEEATTLETLKGQITEDGYYVYGWVKAGGFQKIVNGNTIPKGTLFAFAKEPYDGARMTVKWYDENGNLEAETTAIEGIATAAQGESKCYNLNGQKVNAAYKGVIIKDGKKYIRK